MSQDPTPLDGSLPQAADSLLRAVFPGPDEADIVARLRADGALAAEMIQTEGGQLIGYAALSRMRAPESWAALAPVAVRQDRQRQGVGTKLMALVGRWAEETDTPVVVLGDPAFYGPRGFSKTRAARLETPYDVSYTLLGGPGGDAPAARLIYPVAFAAG